MTSQDADSAPKAPKKGVSVDDLYRRSSQFKLWSYTEAKLQEIRTESNELGKKYAEEKFDKAKEKFQTEQPEVFQQFENRLEKSQLMELITLEEELSYLSYYSKNIVQAANFFKMPTQVRATAISFFKKFYLFNSTMQYHPKNILFTCLFLAAKSENYFLSIESFCKALPKIEPKDILDLEFTVLSALKFTLFVHHPFRPLYGFFLDFQEVLLHPTPEFHDITIDHLGELYDEAKRWLNDYALLSDVCFLFTPPQIALAAMYDCNKRVTEKYLKKKFKAKEMLETIKEQEDTPEKPEKSTTQPSEFEMLVSTIRKCIKLSKQIRESTKEESTKIDEKCFFCINPERLLKKRIKAMKNEANGVKKEPSES